MKQKKDDYSGSLIRDCVRLISCFKPQRRAQVFLLVILQIISAFSEILSLGAIIPFLGALTNIDTLMTDARLAGLFEFLQADTKQDIILWATMLFAAAIVIANIFRLITLWMQIKLKASIGTDIGKEIFQKTLYRPYQYFLDHNSSQIVSNITHDLNGTLGVLQNIFIIMTQGLIVIAIAAGLLIYNPVVAIVLALTVAAAYGVILMLVRKNLRRNSQIQSDSFKGIVQTLQEGLGGIRDIILGYHYQHFIDRYHSIDHLHRNSAAKNNFTFQAPKFLMESIGVLALCGLTISFAMQGADMASLVPLLGFIGLAAHRTLPAMQQIYNAASSILGGSAALHRVLEILEAPLIAPIKPQAGKALSLAQSIDLHDISFGYNNDDSQRILNGLDLRIQANTTIAFVGHTGSGKSTLADLLLGFIMPQSGQICVDDQVIDQGNLSAWQASTAYVPQSIFLMDSSIAENIAFGLPADQIDIQRVYDAAKGAQIHDFIMELPEQYQTVIGEQGVRLSGGQRQRIGIARALYKQAQLIVFDEATSALDNKTEQDVMGAIHQLQHQKTILLIAHRLSTVQNADMIYVLNKGQLVDQGTFHDLNTRCSYFQDLCKDMEGSIEAL